MKQTGELLKTARESKNLSLHEIGMSLKINPKTLQAIESGDLAKLPPKTFLRGFVKSYAQYLKTDVQIVLDTFQNEVGETPVKVFTEGAPTESRLGVPEVKNLASAALSRPTEQKKVLDRPAPHARRSMPPSRALLIISGLFLLGVIILVARLVNKYQKERGSERAKLEMIREQRAKNPDVDPNHPEVLQPPLENPVDIANKIPPVELDPKTFPSNPSDGPISKDPHLLDSKNNTSLPIITAKPVVPVEEPRVANKDLLPLKTADKAIPAANPVVTAKPETKKPPVATVIAAVTTPPPSKTTPSDKSAVDATATDAEVAKPQEVIVEALNKVQISYSLGGGFRQSIELNANEMHTFKSKSNIFLEISDGGAINVIVNGRDKGTPGKLGQALKLSYPK